MKSRHDQNLSKAHILSPRLSSTSHIEQHEPALYSTWGQEPLPFYDTSLYGATSTRRGCVCQGITHSTGRVEFKTLTSWSSYTPSTKPQPNRTAENKEFTMQRITTFVIQNPPPPHSAAASSPNQIPFAQPTQNHARTSLSQF